LPNSSSSIIDTAGFEDATGESLQARMRRQTEQAIASADVCLLLVDARAGLTPVDREFAEIVRRSGKPVIVCANKAEGRAGQAGLYEAFELGLGDAVAISAAHGDGMDDLYEALKLRLPAPGEESEQDEVSTAVHCGWPSSAGPMSASPR
jgi:GTPase